MANFLPMLETNSVDPDIHTALVVGESHPTLPLTTNVLRKKNQVCQGDMFNNGQHNKVNIEDNGIIITCPPPPSSTESHQERAYNHIRLGLRGHMVGGGTKPFIDASWMIHSLESEDARLLRCDIYGEIVQWKVSSGEERSLEFVLGLHDLWSRVIVQWNEERAWWTNFVSKEDQEKEKNMFFDKRDEERIDIHAGRWMGVLSSSTTRSFARIVPSSAVLVSSLDEILG
eukprot:CAMPEP_0184868532 /NCGR_PEP_ID=MMETSP0580-20130426/30786_1 /TAXON_ID=1118495 /ORGANISM="Dactyliosolen fragilissimus" /LENGTH=228 /DNA_ID=CAMNT_0027369493 /DNA_START=296 /DNA_END=982 /DNA_ORIENTATION=-